MEKRIFTAVDISDEARQKVSVCIESLRRQFPDLPVGWVKPEKLHLTLKFFGDVGEIGFKNVEKAVEQTVHQISEFKFQISDFKLKIHSTGVFRNVRNPKILWIGLEDNADLLKTTNEVLENECAKIGFAKEKRIFKPHLTIARLREPHKSKKLAETHLKREFPPIEFEVKSIAIYESTLLQTGSIYQKIKDSAVP